MFSFAPETSCAIAGCATPTHRQAAEPAKDMFNTVLMMTAIFGLLMT